jgi:multimeric flavodoxin WrbA
MALLKKELLSSDMLVLASPLYFGGVSAQLKASIDRWYEFNRQLTAKHLRSAIIVTAYSASDKIMAAVQVHYALLCEYKQFTDMGQIWGVGCGTPDKTRVSGFVEQAYRLGKSF